MQAVENAKTSNMVFIHPNLHLTVLQTLPPIIKLSWVDLCFLPSEFPKIHEYEILHSRYFLYSKIFATLYIAFLSI